jgi:two-component system response regulator
MLDLKLPKVNGIEVLERIKSDTRTRKVPVTVLTSSREEPDIQACYELGVNSYIVKPVDYDQFMKVIKELGLYWLMHNQPPASVS